MNLEIYIADPSLPLPEIFRRQAEFWRASAARWREYARRAFDQKDLAQVVFCGQSAHERVLWAEQAERDMKRALDISSRFPAL